MKYKVQNLRLGFANNSSSSHSIIIVEPGTKDELNQRDDRNYYGWEWFLLASKNEKAKYMAAQLYSMLSHPFGRKVARIVAEDVFGVNVGVESDDNLVGVDHNSIFGMPLLRNGEQAIDFIRDMGMYIVENPSIAIGGGNDNSGPDGREEGYQAAFKDHPWSYSGTARREKDGTWVLFDGCNGIKIRLSPEFARLKNHKSDTPELVDIKITDQCNRGCEYCYQNSTPQGKHCNEREFGDLLYTLDRLQVFEVVLGGGEPTLHPNFAKMLARCHYSHIVPNFTTHTAKWFSNTDIMDAVMKYVGSVAFSCDSLDDAYGLSAALKGYPKVAEKSTVQFVIGVIPPLRFETCVKNLEEAGISRFSLVGYKPVGRAPQKPKFAATASGIKALVKAMGWRVIAVDTALLKEFPGLKQEKTCEDREGLNSMYIDMVKGEMRESSYTGEPVKFKQRNASIGDTYIDYDKEIRTFFDTIGRE
jgi:hypothetical protein